MQNKKFWLLAAGLLLVVGCANNKPVNNKLDKPELTVKDDGTGLIWEPVESAEGYNVTVNGETNAVQEPGYNFSETVGDYNVSVTAYKGKKQSEAAEYAYSTLEGSMGDLSFDGVYITWAASIGAGVEYSVNGGAYSVVLGGGAITVEEAGIYSVRTRAGFVQEDKHYFPRPSEAKEIYAVPAAATDYIIEDGSAPDDPTLAEAYTITKFASTQWEPATTATITLNNAMNAEISEGNCVALKFSHQGYYFMYEKSVALQSTFAGLSFKVKSDASISFTVSFQILHDENIGPINLNGVYLKYQVANAPTLWNQYDLGFDDANWRINYGGQDYTFAQVEAMIASAGYSLRSVVDLLPMVDVFQFRVIGKAGTYNACRIYFDDVALKSEIAENKIEVLEHVELQPQYAFQSDGLQGHIAVNGNNAVIYQNINGNAGSLNATVTVNEDDTVRFVCNTQGYDFDALFTSPDAGKTLTLSSVTGSAAALMQNMTANAIHMLDDFESYTETGIGYDASHTRDQRTGLRAAYYADYYGGGNTSPIGGNGWNLMGSSDYLELNKTSGYTGSNAASLKHNSNTMRFMSYDLTTDAGVSQGYVAKAFCFMIKGHTGTGTVSVRVYYQNKVTASTQQSNSKTQDVTLTAGMGWTLVTVPLDATKTYYGFSLTTKSGASTAQRVLVDDVCFVLA